ncbi:MAG: hypothetical protein QM802_02210 [Agriterribacter sp.]
MENIDYNAFAQECVCDLKALQEKFQKAYGLTWYEDWFYNQATGLLTFSTDTIELNFRYFKVGSFSQKSNTWMWSWNNEHTLDNVKAPALLVKGFGEKSKFTKLTEGCFASDEFEAWEFAAIATKLTNGISAYRPVSEHLQIFLVISEFVDQETAQKIKDKYIKCNEHEYKRIAYVCQHLNNTTKVGFEEAFETYEDMELLEDDDFQAWCNECESVRQKEGEWNDNSMEFAQIKLVCEKCYFEMKELNLGHR